MFSKQELKEFTNFNAVAFDLLRVKSRETKTPVSYWLCMSDTLKQKCRQDFLQWYQDQGFSGPSDSIEVVVNSLPVSKAVGNWVIMEGLAKDARENGDAGGFFIDM